MNNPRYDGEGRRIFTEDEVKGKLLWANITSWAAGAIGGAIALILTGNTGGHQLREIIRQQEVNQVEYQQQCEASLVRAEGALKRAATILEAR